MTALLPPDLDPLEQHLLSQISEIERQPNLGNGFDPMLAATLLEAEITSRVVDHTARWLRAEHGLGYYTIGSAGHESNALIALALRPTDPALLHYRSGGFYVGRSLQANQLGVGTGDPSDDMLRGMMARTTEPIAGGRHKVFGHKALSIIPQTSTIASHLPRAVGLATSFGLANHSNRTWPADSVVVCSFGDASLNHSTAQGAINWAAQQFHAGRRVPIVFVCEDNGLGISVPTTPGWVEGAMANRAGLSYVQVDGADPGTAFAGVTTAIDRVRTEGCPAFIHLETVRFLGHAGNDVEAAYRSPDETRADLERDPILGAAALAIDSGSCDANEVIEWYLDIRSATRSRALELQAEPELKSASEIMEPLESLAGTAATSAAKPGALPAPTNDRLSLAQTINRGLADLLTTADNTIVFGEDVGVKGGVYGVSRGLQKKFGDSRVFDTVLDEQSVIGLALGSALNGFLPIAEIQFLAYLHNAEDQIRGEGATLGFFSQGQYANPMIIRVASYAYQKGFGGHFHNDNSIAVLRDVPGLVIASPAHPADAAAMLHACAQHATNSGALCVFLEPIALYHTTDLHEPGDDQWRSEYTVEPVGIGKGRVHGDGTDLTILTWGNGLFLSLKAAKTLAEREGVSVRILDLRWIAPMPVEQMLHESEVSGRVLVVDETRRTGGVGEGIVAELIDAGFDGPIRRISAHDSFIPLGAAADHVLVSEADIVEAAISHMSMKMEK